jgi:serine/threonine protein kinase
MQVEDSTLRVYLADFGLGKVLTQMYGAGRTTMQAGTPAFQPPEQLKGELCGVGSDIYALGCIIVEVVGGKPVWENMSPHTIILKVAGGHFPSNKHLPPAVQRITDLCLVPAAQRANASTILSELCDIL